MFYGKILSDDFIAKDVTMKKLVIGILAHVDSGKTTLSEGILYKTGEIRKWGRVDHRDTFLDTHFLERERGITIFSKQAVFHIGNSEFTLLDTPGHADFSAETSSSGLCCSDCKWFRRCAKPYGNSLGTSEKI